MTHITYIHLPTQNTRVHVYSHMPICLHTKIATHIYRCTTPPVLTPHIPPTFSVYIRSSPPCTHTPPTCSHHTSMNTHIQRQTQPQAQPGLHEQLHLMDTCDGAQCMSCANHRNRRHTAGVPHTHTLQWSRPQACLSETSLPAPPQGGLMESGNNGPIVLGSESPTSSELTQ